MALSDELPPPTVSIFIAVSPIDTDKVKTIAVIGENAIKMLTVGGGSSSLKAIYELSPLDGIRNRFGSEDDIV